MAQAMKNYIVSVSLKRKLPDGSVVIEHLFRGEVREPTPSRAAVSGGRQHRSWSDMSRDVVITCEVWDPEFEWNRFWEFEFTAKDRRLKDSGLWPDDLDQASGTQS